MKTFLQTRLAAASLLLLCSVLPLLAADYPTTVNGFNPLAYWRFNEAVASPALNTVANASTLGSVADGILVMNAARGEPGAVGTGGALGNSVRVVNVGGAIGNCGSKVDAPYNAAFNPASPFSVEFWAKPNDMPASDSPTFTGLCLISSLDPNFLTGGNRSGYIIYMRGGGTTAVNGKIQFRLGSVNGYIATCSADTGALSPASWSHVVCTWDGSTYMNIYVNGALAGSLSNAPTVAAAWTQNKQSSFRMGGTALTGTLTDAPTISADGRAGNRGFDGWMDEVAMYSVALSPSTIAAHYAASASPGTYGATILADSPVGYWPMNEAALPAPNPSTLPIAVNSGSEGAAADGTNVWGVLANQDGPPYAGLGVGNRACYFDGFSSGHLALTGNTAGLNFSGNITMMAWIKPTVKDFFREIITHGWDATYAETYLRIGRGQGAPVANPPNDWYGYGDNNYYEVGVSDGGSADSVARFPIPDGDLGNWVFVAGTYDGANWNLYRNGALVASVASANGAALIDAPWSVGSRSDPSEPEGLLFAGHIDEPAIFNTALSAGEINTIYNAAQVPPVVYRTVQNPGTLFKGDTGSFSVWAEGSPTMSYLWRSNGISTGVTTTNYIASNLQTGTKTISVDISNPYGSVTKDVTFDVVLAPPSFTKQPVAVSRYTGRPFTFSVTASGTVPIGYQWYTNGIAIPGASSPSYSGTVSAATAGNYSCSISNESLVVVNSSTVALTAVTPPTGTGGAMIADGPDAYWRLDEASGSTAYDNYGGHNATYFATTLGQPGYSVLDPNTAVAFDGENSFAGNINGDPATGGISYAGHVNFTVEAWVNGPAGQVEEASIIAKGTGSIGTTASEQFVLDVAANPSTGLPAFRFFTRGGGNSLYEAFADIGPDGSWHHVVGVYDDLNVLGGGAQLYIVVDGDVRGQAATRPAGLRASTAVVSIGSKRKGNDPDYDGTFNGIVDEVATYSYALTTLQISNHYALAYPGIKPTITRQPESLTVYASSPTPPQFDVGAYGEQPLTYQWMKQGTGDLVDGGNISGANTRKLTIDPVSATDAGNYSVRINNGVGPVTNSAVATLTVIAAPTGPINVPGLVLHLPFDNSLSDVSGRANHGAGRRTTLTTTNAATPAADSSGNPDFYYEAAGQLGQALHYHTATANGGNAAVTNAYFVTLGDKPDLHFGADTDFSVAYWVRFPAFNGIGDLGDLPFISSAVNSYGNPGFTFAPSYNLGSWSYSLNGVVQLYGEQYLLDEGIWHHVVHTFDRTGNAVSYVDGKQRDVRPMAAAGDLDTGNPVNIGQDPTGIYPEEGYYDIDDIGIWRKSLSTLEAVGVYLAATLANSSFTDILGIPTITAGPGANQVTITYPGGVLQSATDPAGPYSDVLGATSPYTTTATGAMFYRTRL